MNRKNGFTLIEIMVSLVVFGMVMATMASAFYKTMKDWQRQRDYNLVLENGRWAMESMTNEIRQAHGTSDFQDTGEPNIADHAFVRFLLDPTGHGNPHGARVYYWRGNSTYGQPYVLYRSQVSWNQAFTPQAVSVNNRKELCRFVVNNVDIFNVSAGCATSTNCTVEVNLTLRPRPDQPESSGNRNYNFRTTVRPRG